MSKLAATVQAPAPAVPQGLPKGWRSSLEFVREMVDQERSCRSPSGQDRAQYTRAISVIDSLLAATPAPAPAQEVTQSEPIYQLQRGDGSWIDQDKASYDYNAQYGINTIRIVYTATAPAQEAMQSFTVPDDLPGMWEHSDLTGGETDCAAPAQEVATLSLAAEDVHAAFTKNFPKSRISQAWINFAADIAQAIAARAAKPAQEVGLTEAERVRCLIASGCIGTVKMTYDSGPYEITRTSINASRLIDAIIAALRAKGG